MNPLSGKFMPNIFAVAFFLVIYVGKSILFPNTAFAWWNANWAHRVQITFSGATTTADTTNFPVLVTLNSSRVNYDSTQDSGQDIRFVDSDDATQLNYEIEKWDETGTSTIWVNVPRVASTTSDFIYMYYRNATAPDAQATTSVWDSNFSGVWHMKETTTSTNAYVIDSTSNANNGSSTASSYPTSSTSGKINGAQDFDKNNDFINIGSAASMDNVFDTDGGGGTLSAWIYPRSLGEGSLGAIIEKNLLFDVWKFSLLSSNRIGFQIEADSNCLINCYFGWNSPTNSINLNAWQFVTIAFDSNSVSNNPQFYINGAPVSATEFVTGDGDAFNSDAAKNAYIGSDLNTTATFDGVIDEVRISDSARSAEWVYNEYKTGTDTLNTYGSTESHGYSTTQVSGPTAITCGAGLILNASSTACISPTGVITTTATATTPISSSTSTPTSTSTSPITTPLGTPFISPPSSFSRNLASSIIGSDVKVLQQFLNQNGFTIAPTGPGSPGNETTFFGSRTKAALIKFQETYAQEILHPIGLTKGTGYFGPRTRGFVEKIR